MNYKSKRRLGKLMRAMHSVERNLLYGCVVIPISYLIYKAVFLYLEIKGK